MKISRNLLVLGLILILLGGLAGNLFDGKSTTPESPSTSQVVTRVKQVNSNPMGVVSAPTIAPVPPMETPPAQFTDEDKAWIGGQVRTLEQTAENFEAMAGPINARLLASAPDEATRAKIDRLQSDYKAQMLKTAELLRNAKPPEDLGEIPLAGIVAAKGMDVPPTAPKFVLPGGETFTISLYYSDWWSLLITEDIPGQTGRFAGQGFQQLNLGKSTILMMHDGALVKFKLVGTLPDPPADENQGMIFPVQPAAMGRNPPKQGNN